MTIAEMHHARIEKYSIGLLRVYYSFGVFAPGAKPAAFLLYNTADKTTGTYSRVY